MTDFNFQADFEHLPDDLKREVVDFIQFLKSKKRKNTILKQRKFGCLKNTIKLAPDSPKMDCLKLEGKLL